MLDTTIKPGQLCSHIWDKYSLINYIYLRFNQHVFGSNDGVAISLKLTNSTHTEQL